MPQFPDFPRDFIHFPDILYLRYTSLNSPISERAWLWRQSVTLQGFDPSATSSIRSELRLMSFWSLWATRAQCMSLDFTQATLAAGGDAHTHLESQHLIHLTDRWIEWIEWAEWQVESVSDLCTGRLSGSKTEGWPSSVNRGRWSRASCSSHSAAHIHKMILQLLRAVTVHVLYFGGDSIYVWVHIESARKIIACWRCFYPHHQCRGWKTNRTLGSLTSNLW